jgi:hypothetical protein
MKAISKKRTESETETEITIPKIGEIEVYGK